MIDWKELNEKLNNLDKQTHDRFVEEFVKEIKKEPRYRCITKNGCDEWEVDFYAKGNNEPDVPVRLNIPRNGIYVMFDRCENDRIVRIGINDSGKNGLLHRIGSNHYNGNGGSAFRRLIENALANSGQISDKDAVSEYIREHISFALIGVPDIDARRSIEERLIKLLTKFHDHNAITGWLGEESTDKVMYSGLWNEDHVEILEIWKRPLNITATRKLLESINFSTDYEFAKLCLKMLELYKKYAIKPIKYRREQQGLSTNLTPNDIEKLKNDIDSGNSYALSRVSVESGYSGTNLRKIVIGALDNNLLEN